MDESALLEDAAVFMVGSKTLQLDQFDAELSAALGDPEGYLSALERAETGEAALHLRPADADPETIAAVVAAHEPRLHWDYPDDIRYLHDVRVKALAKAKLTVAEKADQMRALLAATNGLLPHCTCTEPLA